jgi:hypothetical protein
LRQCSSHAHRAGPQQKRAAVRNDLCCHDLVLPAATIRGAGARPNGF